MKMSEVSKEYFIDTSKTTLMLMLYNLIMLIMGRFSDKLEYIGAKYQKTYNVIRYVLNIKERNLYKFLSRTKAKFEAVYVYSEAMDIVKKMKDSWDPDVEPNLAEMNKVLLSVASAMDERITIYEWKFPIDSLLRNFHKKEFISKIKQNCFTTNIVNLCEKFSNIYSNIIVFNADNLVMLRQNINKDPPFY